MAVLGKYCPKIAARAAESSKPPQHLAADVAQTVWRGGSSRTLCMEEK